jgi:hypothetical protein
MCCRLAHVQDRVVRPFDRRMRRYEDYNESRVVWTVFILCRPCDLGRPVTPALLRLDPIWDPLRADPAFQKLCEEKPH